MSVTGALKAMGGVLMWLVVFDVVGVVACLVLDVAPLRHNSSALPYTIWFVLGIFCGLMCYHAAGYFMGKADDTDWYERMGASRTGAYIIGLTATLLSLLSAIFYALWWRHPMVGEFFVPDSASTTLTFFMTILLSMAFFRHTFAPEKPGKRGD